MNAMQDIASTGVSERVAIVLPCLNEARTIEWCVRRAHKALDELDRRHGLPGEVIVADNGSTDGSRDLAAAAGARVVPVAERGYGAALHGGFAAAAEAGATYLVMGDSDCSYDFLESVEMIEKLRDGAELCMGSRFKGEIKPGAMPWKNRYIGNPVLSGILRLLFRTKISDSHCGLRAIRTEAYERLNLSSTGMEFASEMVLKSVLHELTIDEVPITLSPDGRDRPPHLNPWRDGLRHLIYMFLLSPKHLFLWPAIVMSVFGLAVFALLLTAGGSELARIGPFRIGDHFAVAASAALVVGVQTGITGIFATLYSVQRGYRRPSSRVLSLLKRSRLEYWILGGTGLTLIGLIWAITITANWVAQDFGQLDQIRNLIAAATLSVIGLQVFFSGFLLSIFAGNRSSHLNVL
ncbi:glycosyltransferase family 2 protein [Litorisediminicola beolgyonensis]|uniref:Glycosyltransferase family 2 protein n=1 Tax=Litorisediminicola beolgyonensis TaxID=1173614 RepID=A0ABW3ZJN4_9RHOB